MHTHEIFFFSAFLVFIALMLALDLGVFSKKNQEVKFKQAAIMSATWVTLALGFFVLLKFWGHELHDIRDFESLRYIVEKHSHNIKIIPESFEASRQIYNNNLSLEFITGYIVEYALSVDNIFVMVLIFSSFGVSPKHYH